MIRYLKRTRYIFCILTVRKAMWWRKKKIKAFRIGGSKESSDISLPPVFFLWYVQSGVQQSLYDFLELYFVPIHLSMSLCIWLSFSFLFLCFYVISANSFEKDYSVIPLQFRIVNSFHILQLWLFINQNYM